MAENFDDIGDFFTQALGRHKVKIAKSLYENLMETTPEKTGALKGNWYINKGLNVGGKEFDKSRTEQPTPDVERFKESKANALTIYNPAPYIVLVNNGEGGNQANQNFVQKAMQMTEDEFG